MSDFHHLLLERKMDVVHFAKKFPGDLSMNLRKYSVPWVGFCNGTEVETGRTIGCFTPPKLTNRT